jgi:hypothetical protein
MYTQLNAYRFQDNSRESSRRPMAKGWGFGETHCTTGRLKSDFLIARLILK